MGRMTTGTNANLLLDVFHGKLFIEALREKLVVLPLALMEDGPTSSGKTVRWQYFGNPAAVTTPLSEGGDPTSPRDLATTAVTAALDEYGDYFEPSKMLLATGATGTKAEIVKAAGYQAAISMDTLCFTQSLYDTTQTLGGGAAAAFTADNLRAAFAGLMGNSANPHPKTNGGKYFAAVLAVEAGVDMMNETTDYSSTQAPNWNTAHTTDMGTRGIGTGIPFVGDAQFIWGCQLYISQNVPSESADQENNYVIGNEGFGALSVTSDLLNPRVIITDPEERTDKPLRNSGTVGWWVDFVSELINSNSVVELLSDIT